MVEPPSNQIPFGPVVHLITDAGLPELPHPYFRTLIESGGIERRSIVVGTVGPAGPLQEEMCSRGVRSFALGVQSRSRYPYAVARLVRLLRYIRAQVVQTHLLDASLVGLSAARIAKVPVAIMMAHHSHELPFHGQRVLWTERLCAGPLCDHVIAPSRQVTETLREFAKVPERKIEVVHHGFDLDRLQPSKANAAAVRTELGLDGKLVLGAIGRLYRLKNHAVLVKAFSAVLGGDPDARLVIVGEGDPIPLTSLAARLGIADQVMVCHTREDIPNVLAAFDAFVHPSIAESFGMVIVEAMALARPVLSTPVGIAPEVIDPEKTGVLASSDTEDALVQGLRRLLELRDDWPSIGQAARNAVKGFTAAAMAARYASLYQQWLVERQSAS